MDNTNNTTTSPKKSICEESVTKSSNKLDFKSAQFVRAMLKSLPKDLRKIFTPKTDHDLATLEIRLVQFLKRQKERDQVILIQNQFGLPLRPNIPLEKVAVYVRIAMMKQERLLNYYYSEDNYKDPPNGISM